MDENKKEKQPTKVGIYMTDIFLMFPMTLLVFFGFICLLFAGGFVGVCGFTYLYKSFLFDTTAKILGSLALSIFAILCFALFTYIEYLIVKSTMKGLSNYAKDRKELLKIAK